ncbi:WG repeat-containing protein [Aestuariivivens sediminis]|uniref:WG repeat-containing protein n=1 Tax=Aestuariivivens sediminis TaxID=2913557 RepID=UPI001F57CE76|nr:WG repeat-containing protein [Aestuariivivens sediminis]
MKNLFIILLICPFFVSAQITEELDYIAPFNDGVAAVQKGNSWGFINHNGLLIIDFRDDLVTTAMADGYKYPVFNDDRSLISKKIDGILYFGYIDKTGKTAIVPQFLNASNFNNGQAIALHIIKERLGDNEVLGKNVVNYKYFEVIIDIEGNIVNYLNPKGVNVVLDKGYLQSPPKITSRPITDDLYAVISGNKKWRIVSITNDQEYK